MTTNNSFFDSEATAATSSTSTESRQKRRKSSGPKESECPVCGITLRSGKFPDHLRLEISKLVRLPQTRPVSQRTRTAPTASSSSPFDDAVPSTSSSDQSKIVTSQKLKEKLTRKGVDWAKYEKIRGSRQVRSREKLRRRTSGSGEAGDGDEFGERECPVCDKSFPSGDIEQHITRCLRQAETEYEDEEVDVEGDEYEEYEWCGVTRVRATTLLGEDQLHAIGTKVKRGSEDEIVDVCDDDVAAFGPSQYTENDISSLDESDQALCLNSNSQEHRDGQENMHHSQQSSNKFVAPESTTSSDSSVLLPSRITVTGDAIENSEFLIPEGSEDYPPSATSNTRTDDSSPHLQEENHIACISTTNIPIAAENQINTERENVTGTSRKNHKIRVSEDKDNNINVAGGAAMEALRVRIRELEEERIRGRYACRVCHGDYDKPVVSICCWHVHCETCWLHALAAKKLCPQCSVITSTTDLRRVYL